MGGQALARKHQSFQSTSDGHTRNGRVLDRLIKKRGKEETQCAMRQLSVALGGLKNVNSFRVEISIIEIRVQRCITQIFIPR